MLIRKLITKKFQVIAKKISELIMKLITKKVLNKCRVMNIANLFFEYYNLIILYDLHSVNNK